MDRAPGYRRIWKLLGITKKKEKSTKHIIIEDCNPRTRRITQQNASQSILLSLPLEILEMIVSYVIGANGNLIHMKHTQSDHMALYALGDVHIRQKVPGFNRYKLSPLPPPGFRQAICVAAQTEDAAYAETNSKDQSVHTGQTPEYEIERNATRHTHCACCGPADLKAVPEKLHLALLASCRQLYHLATTTLYPNNTFSFDDALSFTHFLANLDPNQKSMIRSLHLSRPSVDISVRTSNRTTWMNALQPSSIRTPQGLRTVHLCLDMNIHTPNSRGAHTAYKIIFLEADLEPFLQLHILPLTKATVVISDDVSTFMSMTGESSLHGRWTVAEKNVWAEKTRLKLLEPCVEDAEGVVVPGEEVANGMSVTKRVRRIFNAWIEAGAGSREGGFGRRVSSPSDGHFFSL